MLPIELRFVMKILYEIIIYSISAADGGLEEIKCNIEVMKGCPLSTTLFVIYIDKLDESLEDAQNCLKLVALYYFCRASRYDGGKETNQSRNVPSHRPQIRTQCWCDQRLVRIRQSRRWIGL